MRGTRLLATAAAAMLLGAASSASALTIAAGDLPSGVGSVAGAGWTASSSRNFQSKTVNGVTATGLAAGFVGGEIDLDGEAITITFATPQRLDSISLAFLFSSGNFGDTVGETARLSTPSASGDLAVLTATTASWSGPGGSVLNVSPGNSGGAGLWTILDPFGAIAVTSLTLRALQVGAGPAGSANSDFSFSRLEASAPPPVAIAEPLSAVLLGAGLGGLALFRRR